MKNPRHDMQGIVMVSEDWPSKTTEKMLASPKDTLQKKSGIQFCSHTEVNATCLDVRKSIIVSLGG